MPCSCFGKKDKKAGAAAEDKYSRPHEQEPLLPSSQAPLQTQGPAPAQAEPTAATPPTPHTPPGGDARLRPEDDPDKASRRRDVVASFYSDQCELIGFKATGSRPPSAVVGGAGEGPAATSSPLGSPPSSSRSCATSRADLAMKRREFFKDLAVNDISSARYGNSEPTWKLVDSGSLTTPRRSHQHDTPHHHTLPAQARYGGLILRPVSTPSVASPSQEARITNGHSDHSLDHRTHDFKDTEGELLLGGDLKQEPAQHPQTAAGQQEAPPPHHSVPAVEEPFLSSDQSSQDQSTPSSPATPPATPATPPATPVVPRAEAEPLAAEAPLPSQPLELEVPIEPAATQSGGGGGEYDQLVVQQQYVQQVSVGSDDERLAEGSCILIKEAFPDEPHEPRTHPDTPPPEAPDTASAPGSPPAPSATHEAAWDVSQHSSEQPAAPPPTESPGQRRASLPGAEEAAGERSPQHTGEAALDSDQHSRPTSSSDSSAPGSPQQLRQPLENEAPSAAAAATLEQQQQQDPPSPQQEPPDSPGEARPGVTIVGCIPKAASSEEADPHLPSPPTTPPADSPPSPTPAEVSQKPAPPTVDDRAPPSPPTPPSLTEPGLTCGVDASSSPLEDDGLGSDIDDALSSLECLTEEGNTEKRAAAST